MSDNMNKPSFSPNVYSNRWTLDRLLCVDIGERTLVIHEGFECDGASIPRVLWRLVGPPTTPRGIRAAFVHDYLYTHGDRLEFTRKQADAVFLRLMREDRSEKPWLKWVAVRLFAAGHWESC